MTEENDKKRYDPLTPTERDEALSSDLANVRVAITEHIAGRFWPASGTVYFPAADPAKTGLSKKGGRLDKNHVLARVPSVGSAERRLRKLKGEKILLRRRHRTKFGATGLWMLSKGAFRREVRDLGRHEEPYPGWPKHRLQHLLDTNDVYFQLASELDAILGPCHGLDPAWQWLDERRAYERYSVSWETRPRYHQPDAEIRFLGRVFILERQTERARETQEAMRDKVQRHEARAEYLGIGDRTQILFACDTLRDIGYAQKAGEECGLPVIAGSVEEVVSYLADEALRIK